MSKGSTPRKVDQDKFAAEYERIFRKDTHDDRYTGRIAKPEKPNAPKR